MKRVLIRLLAVCLCAAVLAGCGGAATNWQEQYDLGMQYLSEENYKEAILAFTEAINIDPNRAELYISRAGAYITLGETEENLAAALADYEQAKELGYTAADLWLGLADVYIRQGNLDKAREVLEEGLEATGGDPDIQAKLDELNSGTVTDAAGNLRLRQGFNEDGSLAWYHMYTYDEEGQETGVTHYDAAGNELGHVDLLYDENGRLVQEYNHFSSDGWLIRVECTYDEEGRIKKEISYPLNGNQASVNETIYNDEGKLYRRNNLTLDGQLLGYTLYGWEDKNNQLEWMETYSEANILQFRVSYLRDDQGHPIREEVTGPDGKLISYVITEYQGDESIRTTFDADGNVLYSNAE